MIAVRTRRSLRRRPFELMIGLACSAILAAGKPPCFTGWLTFMQAVGTIAVLPLYVRLPEFTRAQEIDPSIDLIKFVAAMARANGCPDLEDALRDELRDDRRRTLVLLDGLDEVGDEKRMTGLIKSVRAFIEQFPRNRFVITSRIVGFDPLPWTNLGFTGLRILDFGQKHQQDFAEKWVKILATVHNQHAAEVREQMNSAIFSNPRVRTLAANPLILTILVLLNEIAQIGASQGDESIFTPRSSTSSSTRGRRASTNKCLR